MEKSTVKIVDKKVLIPFIMVTSLFALWGFANSVTDPMVAAFGKVLELSNSEAAWVQTAFYGGYFSMALPAALFIRRYSYKTGILIGLALFAGGALLFYPAAITEQFWFFCLGLYILTFGLAFLETSANPYVLAMGDPKTATQRLNFAQAFNPMGTIGGLLIAKNFVLDKLQSDNIVDYGGLAEADKTIIRTADLMAIRDPYVVLGFVLIAVFIIFALVKMPQAKDNTEMPSIKSIFSRLLRDKKYLMGVISQACCVGAQIMCWTYIYAYAQAIGVNKSQAANYQLVAFGLFLLGRMVGTYLLNFFRAGKLLMIFSSAGVIFGILTMFITGIGGLYCLVMMSCCMSIMFPTIYGISLDGLKEDEVKLGSAGLIMAIVGGALMPPLQGSIIDVGGVGVMDTLILGVSEINFSFILPVLCIAFVAYYGFWACKNHQPIIIDNNKDL